MSSYIPALWATGGSPCRVQFLCRTTQCPLSLDSCFFYTIVSPIAGSFLYAQTKHPLCFQVRGLWRRLCSERQTNSNWDLVWFHARTEVTDNLCDLFPAHNNGGLGKWQQNELGLTGLCVFWWIALNYSFKEKIPQVMLWIFAVASMVLLKCSLRGIHALVLFYLFLRQRKERNLQHPIRCQFRLILQNITHAQFLTLEISVNKTTQNEGPQLC